MIVPPFDLTITIADNSYTFQVVHIPVSGVIEHFRIVRGSSESLLQSNRPMLRAKGQGHRRPDIKWLSGNSWDQTWRTRIARALAEKLVQEVL